MRNIRILQILLFVFVISGCSSLILKPVKYAWPIESVLQIDQDGFVEDPRFSIKINVNQLLVAEFGSLMNEISPEIRILRNDDGYYFITSSGFKNVYVFSSEEKTFHLENKIEISQMGMEAPVMNQRSPYIELIDGQNKFMLTQKGIEGN